jgi:hypothetical protein
MQRSNSVERNLNGMPQPIVQDLASEVGKAVWGPLLAPDMVSPSVIKQALERAQGILLPGLKEDGNFLYQFIQIVDAQGNSENSVRQAGALWTLALIHQYSSLNKVQGANRSTNMALPSRILALQYKGGRRMTQQQDTTSSLGLLGGGGFRSPLVSSSFRIEVAQYSEHELIVALNVLNEPP